MDESERVDENENKRDDKKTKFLEAVDKYYEMKDQYETMISDEKKKIASIKGLSWKEKRFKYSEYRPKCINCSRPVGTLFSCKANKDIERILSARCGDKENPCPLDIRINLAETQDLRSLLKEDEINNKTYKNNIILDKNDFLFGYITSETAVANFEKLKDDVIQNTENMEFFLTLFNNITDSKEKKESIDKLKSELYANIDNIKKMNEEYKNTQNKQYIVDAVDIYVDDMIPRLKKLMNKKYAMSYVDYEDGVYKLIQQPYNNEQLEMVLGEENQKVEKMQLGLKKEKNKKEKKGSKKTKEPTKNEEESEEELDEEGNKKYNYKEEERIGD